MPKQRVAPLLETLLCQDGIVYNLPYHQARYERSACALGLPRFSLAEYLHHLPTQGTFKVRLRCHQNITRDIEPYTPKSIHSLQLVVDNTITYTHKSSNREALNRLFQRRAHCDDILIVKNGTITDTSIANIAFFDGSHWYTPKHPLLHGTKRAELLDKNSLRTADIYPSDIENFSSFALMNALMGFTVIENGIISR